MHYPNSKENLMKIGILIILTHISLVSWAQKNSVYCDRIENQIVIHNNQATRLAQQADKLGTNIEDTRNQEQLLSDHKALLELSAKHLESAQLLRSDYIIQCKKNKGE